jgi:hypothetical protein
VLLTRPRLIAAALLIASAALLAAGTAVERHSSSEPHAAHPATSQAATSSDTAASTTGPETTTAADSGGDSDGDQGTDEHATPSRVAHAGRGDEDGGNEHGTIENSEKLLGINPEATPLTLAAVTASVLLAVAMLIIGSPILAAGTALAMAAFTALDIREVIHQLDKSHTGLATLATSVALLHVLAAAVVLTVARSALVRPDPGNSAASARGRG